MGGRALACGHLQGEEPTLHQREGESVLDLLGSDDVRPDLNRYPAIHQMIGHASWVA